MVILNQIKKINFSIKIFLQKKILINYLKFKIIFLKIDNDLKVMLKDFFRFDANKVSRLWLYLLYDHLKRLENIEYNNFNLYNKRIFKNYTLRFNTLENYLDINQILKINVLEREREREVDRNIVTYHDDISKLMLNFLKDKGAHSNYLKDIEPQDKIQSAIEIEYLKNNIDFKNIEFIIELGAGYGRIPESLIRNNVKKTYIVIDIPPALYLSQKYLGYNFPSQKILKYNTKLTSQNLKENLRLFDLIFLLPHQMTFLKNILPIEKTTFICINALQEFPKHTIIEIFEQLKEIAKYVYIKSANLNINNPYKDELLNFDSIIKTLNKWNIKDKKNNTFPSSYSEAILFNNEF
jgi:hypothetical protein